MAFGRFEALCARAFITVVAATVVHVQIKVAMMRFEFSVCQWLTVRHIGLIFERRARKPRPGCACTIG